LTIVVDASLALAWCLPNEATSRTDEILNEVTASSAVVPPVWPFEMANALLNSERRRRIDTASTAGMVDFLSGLPITLDSGGSAFSTILALARQYHLTVYDASYLELAMRLGLRLATNDSDLKNAAIAVGVEAA
jgi:predicted nucleic acid-binding protein